MANRNKVIEGLKECIKRNGVCYWKDNECPYVESCKINAALQMKKDALEIATNQPDKEPDAHWQHLWDAPDKTFKGRCSNCGFVHCFIEGHDTQYKYCPMCGFKMKEE